MTVTAEQFVNGLIAYADREVIPKISTQSHQIISGVAIALMQKNTVKTIENIADNPTVKALGIIDDRGLIDAELLLYALQDSVQKHSNGKFTFVTRKIFSPFSGLLGHSGDTFTFSDKDLHTIYGYIKTAAGHFDE